jgi:hypothetical protein
MDMRKGGGSTTFCEQKVAKKLQDFGPWAVTSPTSMAQKSKGFLLLFFKALDQ